MNWDDTLRQAKADQAQAGMQDFAAFLVGYYRALLAQGLPADLAAVLTGQMQELMLTGKVPPAGPPT